ncbi:MAG: DUF3298 domain-containing protein [Cellulosilyticaceae bacterium]
MKNLEEARGQYEQIQVPEGYQQLIEKTIQSQKENKMMAIKHYLKVGVAVATIGLGTFGGSLYASEDFARGMYQLPVIGDVARVLTFNKYVEDTDAYSVDAEIPHIKSNEDNVYINRVNQAIQAQMSKLLEEAKVRGEESQKAYLETGGDAGDYRGIAIDMNYELKYNVDHILSFAIYKTETMASAYDTAYFYNLDLAAQKPITLEDFFGPDYKTMIDSQIKEQMKERELTQGAVYFEGFTGINKDQNFYINEKGHCVIVFDKYEIAPGSMGMQEFEILNKGQLLQLKPQASYEVEQTLLAKQTGISYPQVVSGLDDVLKQTVNENLYSVVKKYQNPQYTNLNLGYKVTRIDDQVLSILYRGSVEIEGLGTKMIYESVTVDMTQGGQQVTIQSVTRGDEAAKEVLKNLIKEKLEGQDDVESIMEGLRVYFKDQRAVFYYMLPDDSKQQIVEVEIGLDELAQMQ